MTLHNVTLIFKFLMQGQWNFYQGHVISYDVTILMADTKKDLERHDFTL